MHSVALVPLASWAYAKPELLVKGQKANIGLIAEALIYYDTIYIETGNPECFRELVSWFISQNEYETFISLINDGIIKFYDYEFLTGAVSKNDIFEIFNLQSEKQTSGNMFEERYLYNHDIESILPNRKKARINLYKAIRGNIIEEKAEQYTTSVSNAREDYKDEKRNSLCIQAFIDEVYRYRNLGIPPQISAKITSNPENDLNTIDWGINFTGLSRQAGTILGFNNGTPLTAFALANRLVWSAAKDGFDLFLPTPMSRLVGDKLFESTAKTLKLENIIISLEKEVEFPNIQNLVNNNIINIKDILTIRKNAKKFRDWLQQESDRDRNAIFAYHSEVAKASGFSSTKKTILEIFGVLSGGALAGAIGAAIAGPVGGAVGGMAGSGLTFLTDIVSKLGQGWKPIVFGNWYEEKIKRIISNS